MKRSTIIILPLFLLLLSGCQEKQQTTSERPKAPIAGIKLSDIQPEFGIQQPTEMTIRVFTYEIPARNSMFIEELYDELSKHYLKFPDIRVFEENGFEAGFGIQKTWSVLANKLYMASAKSIITNDLLFIDTSSNDIAIDSTRQGQIFFLHKRSNQPELIKLPAGQLVWEINARALTERKGVGLVKIEAAHLKDVLPTIKKIPGYEQSGQTTFNDISIKLNMSPGEFVVIGPKIEDNDQIRLSNLYFEREGNFVSPITDDDQKLIDNGMVPTEASQRFKVEKNIPLLRLYIFACMDVKN